jgi:pimeloyl-ACP methyl ester carboxylesterase
MYYEIHGEGFPYVMIMAMAGDVNWWTPEIIEASSQNYKTITFDNRGTGQTDEPAMDYSMKLFADDTVSLMDALNIEKAHILGVCMGGFIAQELALSYPNRVEKLILGCTHCGGSKQIPPSGKIMRKMMSPKKMTTDDFISLMFTKDFINENPDFVESYRLRMLKTPISSDSFNRQKQAIMGFSSGMRLRKIKLPTLILHGKEDIIVPPGNAEILAKRIPRAKLIMLDNVAHFLFQPNPERVYNEINSFLSEEIKIEAQ